MPEDSCLTIAVLNPFDAVVIGISFDNGSLLVLYRHPNWRHVLNSSQWSFIGQFVFISIIQCVYGGGGVGKGSEAPRSLLIWPVCPCAGYGLKATFPDLLRGHHKRGIRW